MRADDHGEGAESGRDVEVRRSGRRRRTVTAFRENGRMVVVIPAAFTAEQEAHWVDRMRARVEAKERTRASDGELEGRARRLSAQYLDGRAVPVSVRWVTNQSARWGSCTPADGSIRLSHHLQEMPGFVVDYVLLHELTHLLEPNHSSRFWEILEAYPRTERARGFLEGVEHRWGRTRAGKGEPEDAVCR